MTVADVVANPFTKDDEFALEKRKGKRKHGFYGLLFLCRLIVKKVERLKMALEWKSFCVRIFLEGDEKSGKSSKSAFMLHHKCSQRVFKSQLGRIWDFKGILTKRLITTEPIFMTLSLRELSLLFRNEKLSTEATMICKMMKACIMMEPSKAIKATHININFRRNETTCCLPAFMWAQISRSKFSRSPQLRLIDASTILNRRRLELERSDRN